MFRALLLATAAILALSACKDEPVTPPAPQCGYDADCATGQVCKAGACFATATCIERAQCKNVPVCAGDTCICHPDERRCLPVCETDNECPADGQCVNGRCTKYVPEFSANVPGGGAKKPLEIGIGRVDLDFPMGVSMAGFATRRGPETPYRSTLGGSHSWFDRPDVRAIVLDSGEDMIILLRVPLGWSDDFLVTQTAIEVQRRTGLNVLDKIVTSAPHSHHQPARFWHLVVGLNFGIFGYDEFSWEVFDRLTSSFADAVVAALEAKRPGRFGWTVVEDFDPDDKVHRDRRGQNNNLPGHTGKDGRLLLLRFDDAEGQPIALAAHFGIHGTVFDFDNPMLTGDAPGGVEVFLQKRAAEKYGRDVLGLFLQGNAGDVSPGGDDLDHTSIEQMQLVGHRAWALMEPHFDAIVTKSDVDIDIATGRFPISRAHLGYTGNTFHDDNVICENTPPYFRYGSFQCMEGLFKDEDPSTKFTDGMLNCVFAVECLTDGYPIPQFMKTRLSVMRIGDLALSTMPGEPLSKFGLDNAAGIKAKLPMVRDAFTLGYSQDHHFYLMGEEDWFQGGYEPSRDIWGWRLAPYFSERAAQLAGELAKPRAQRVRDDGNLKPMFWDRNAPGEEIDRVEPTETMGDPAGVVDDVPARVERLDRVRFAWNGGHPGVDLPRVFLERANGDGFDPVTRPGGAVYRDGGFEMVVKYEGRCDLTQCNDHRWAVRWEEARDFPLGAYRFRVEGRAKKGGQIVDYRTASARFELVPSSQLEIYGLVATNDGVEGRVLDPRAVRRQMGADGAQTMVFDGHRLRSELGSSANGTPLPIGVTLTATGSVTLPGGGATLGISGAAQSSLVASEDRTIVTKIAADGTPETRSVGMRATTRFQLPVRPIAVGPAGAYRVTIRLDDEHGNWGTVSSTVTK